MEKTVMQPQLLIFQPKTSLTFISKGRMINIPFEEITHVRKFGPDVIVYGCGREYRTKYSLQEIMNDLPVNEFFRVHRSHIVALKHVASVKKGKIQVQNVWLPVSVYYKRQLCESLGTILNREYEFLAQL